MPKPEQKERKSALVRGFRLRRWACAQRCEADDGRDADARWNKLRQKKTALGHAEDDHEDWNIE